MGGIRKVATIKQVAEEAGVSMMTVSAVLRPPQQQQPQQRRQNYPVAGATRERVLAAARKLNYFPSAVAQGMRGQPMNTLGVVLINPGARIQGDPYVGGVLDGIISVANAAGQNTTLFTGQRWSNAAESLAVFCDGRTDGLIILSPAPDSDIVPALLDVNLPFVLVSGHSDDPRVSSVGIDSVAPMETLVRHVLELGHRRVAMLSGRASSDSTQQRLEGYRRALAAFDIAEDQALVRIGSYSATSGYEQTQYLLGLPAAQRPTALCCGSDRIALGALRALNEAGLRVPEDMSLTGFDDMPDAADFNPPLTTVHQPVGDIGRRAAELLLAIITEGVPLGIKEVLPTEVIFRQSVAPPPGP